MIHIRQTYDIWCLGCVYLEFITWLLGGRELQVTFAVVRATPDVLQQSFKTDTFFEAKYNEKTEMSHVSSEACSNLGMYNISRSGQKRNTNDGVP